MNDDLKDKMVYICTKLYNYNDKLQAEYLEEAILSHIGCKTFVPFRDSNENELIGVNRTKIVYDADIERLNSKELSLLAVLYDGICKDEGISFEIGYAFGKGVPVFIINTDFIWYAIDGVEFIFDPVISYMATDYLHEYNIEDCPKFKDSLIQSQSRAFNSAAIKIKDLLCKTHRDSIEFRGEKYFDVFVDFGGGRYEYQREYARWIKNTLSCKGIKTVISKRFLNPCNDSGKNDVQNMLNSDILVFLGDELELNSGTAALLGLARSINKKIILYESSSLDIHGENEHRMKKNLMIDFSVDIVAKTKEKIIDLIMEELNVQ